MMFVFLIGACAICLDMIFGDLLSTASKICETGRDGFYRYRGLGKLSFCLLPYAMPLAVISWSIMMIKHFKSIIPVVICIILALLFYFTSFLITIGIVAFVIFSIYLFLKLK